MSDKLPKLKIPYALNVNVGQAKLLSQFLDFKLYNPQGRLTPKDYGRIKKQRVSNRYWLEKLVNAGWAYRDGKAYCLKSYDHVWAMLRVNKTKAHKHRGLYTKFYKLDPEEFDLEKKIYNKQIIDLLLKRTASNQMRRMRFKRTHNTCQSSDERVEFFGVRKAAKLFGFKSPSTGHKYRKLYFEVIPSERKLRRTSKEEYRKWGGVEFLYEADKIAL